MEIDSTKGARILKKAVSLYLHGDYHKEGTSVTLWEDLLGLAGKAMSDRSQK